MHKPTQFVVMSLVLFMTMLLIGAVSNESVNKDKSASTAIPPVTLSQSQQQSHGATVAAAGGAGGAAVAVAAPAIPVHAIADHLDLPTKFGDEDDVIESKAAAEKKAAESAGIGVAAHGHDDDDEHYEDEDDDFLSGHSADKNGGGSHHRDTDESEADYEDESDLGPTLDNFGAKLDGSDAGNELPIFLIEPQSAYAVRNRPAILKCKAAHALQVGLFSIIFYIRVAYSAVLFYYHVVSSSHHHYFNICTYLFIKSIRALTERACVYVCVSGRK